MTDSLHDEITRVAYGLYEKSNRQQGNDLLNWLAAERIVQFLKMLIPSTGDAVALLEYKPMYGTAEAVRAPLRKPPVRMSVKKKAAKDSRPERVGKGA